MGLEVGIVAAAIIPIIHPLMPSYSLGVDPPRHSRKAVIISILEAREIFTLLRLPG